MKKDRKIAKAAAIQYNPDNHKAPVVIATGTGTQAERILELAKEHNIPLQEDTVLIEALMKLDIGEEVPVELYQVVAEVLVYIRKLNQQAKAY
ncbi:EscU/YscU/HrcU family type III secretion system export apparatus switch protein [Desulfuribacillus alkaliarsenatis]|uniref:FhlB domain-containing protein n=1 Tax=Desulfuribacillus alkaliarsenatis TaxID=766136 RepID=A0A1E5G5U3_9FIRM|nr:EscU/YscU/HrcU family type III secretion system export apparatus switch protein [Desulfuribacillus alkaliarsenatis]OEF98577.1 FhlB domain-containing protein [Desulfuribacillus alkaliarsenatis]